MSAKVTKKMVLMLFFVVAGMFGFGFALVPLYDVFCKVTGLNGKTNTEAYQAVDVKIDTSRTVTVEFVATNNDKMEWRFRPDVARVKVHPGELTSTTFFAENPSDHRMVGQAIPSISPGRAAEFFHKTECFCFGQQTLAVGESIDMPLRFIVDQDLPKDIETITLAYTLFDVTDRAKAASEK